MADRDEGCGCGIWFFTGLLIGLFVTFLLWLEFQPTDLPTVDSQEVSEANKKVESEQSEPKQSTSKNTKQESKKTNKKTESTAKNNDFDFQFYTMLPEMEVVVSGDKQKEKRPKSSKSTKYELQAGAFRRHKDADGLKAKLSLLGLTARVQVVTIDDDRWYRVRVGPYESSKDAKVAKAQLLQNGIKATSYRISK